MSERIHKDTDMILKDYSAEIIARKLSGAQMPDRFNGVYNTYYIKEVSEEYALDHSEVYYGDAEAYLKRQEDFASSRIRRQVFSDNEGRFYEITVSLPTFEHETLVEHVLWWTGILFVALLITLFLIGILVTDYNMRPFRKIMKWIDSYEPGMVVGPVPSDTDVLEFRKLAEAVQEAVDRFEHEYEERKIFIGNASHELQTPLAVCSNRLEMLLDRPDMNEDLAGEIVRIRRSILHLIRLNKTLLLLSRIENNQFPETSAQDLTSLLRDSVSLNEEIYAHKSIAVSMDVDSDFVCNMNDQMASVLVGNLVKNAFVHSPAESEIKVIVSSEGFTISNPGGEPLDSKRIFRRFYQPGGRREGSTGLGLALAYSVCIRSGLELKYDFAENRHVFFVNLKK
jgi:signal transduction histidine kinase